MRDEGAQKRLGKFEKMFTFTNQKLKVSSEGGYINQIHDWERKKKSSRFHNKLR